MRSRFACLVLAPLLVVASAVSFAWAQNKAPAAPPSAPVATSAPANAATNANTPKPAAAGTGATAPVTGAPPTAAPAPVNGASGSAQNTAAATSSLDGSTYQVRLRDLEQHIDELKEQIRRSHTRLSLLSDTILSGGVGGARAEVTFKNDLSSAFRLTGVTVVLDGAVQYNKLDESDASPLSAQKEIPIFSGSIPPGDHTLQLVVHVRGHGYGVFSYLRGYQVTVKGGHSFTVTEGKTIVVEATAWEKGDVTTPLEQRPALRYTTTLKTGVSGGGDSAAALARPVANSKASGGVSVGTGAR